MVGLAVAQDNEVQRSSARDQLQHIHSPQSIYQELARLTNDLVLTTKQQQKVRPRLKEHHDKNPGVRDKNLNASRQELGSQIYVISDETR
jgi:hypothetical protein